MQLTLSVLNPMEGVSVLEIYTPQYDLAVLVYPVKIDDILVAFTYKEEVWECKGMIVVSEEVKAFVITLIKNGRFT